MGAHGGYLSGCGCCDAAASDNLLGAVGVRNVVALDCVSVVFSLWCLYLFLFVVFFRKKAEMPGWNRSPERIGRDGVRSPVAFVVGSVCCFSVLVWLPPRLRGSGCSSRVEFDEGGVSCGVSSM